MKKAPFVALIKGDGIGVDVSDAAISAADAACATTGAPQLMSEEVQAGARYFSKTGRDIEVDGASSIGSSNVVGSRRTTTSLQATTLPSSSSHRSGCGSLRVNEFTPQSLCLCRDTNGIAPRQESVLLATEQGK